MYNKIMFLLLFCNIYIYIYILFLYVQVNVIICIIISYMNKPSGLSLKILSNTCDNFIKCPNNNNLCFCCNWKYDINKNAEYFYKLTLFNI